MSIGRLFASCFCVALLATACAASSEDDPATTNDGSESGDNDLRGVKHCGGIAAIPCGKSEVCVDDPIDSCDPNNGGRDCSGICVDPKKAQTCGGIAAIQCPAGQRCVDNPSDGCDPATGADCGGICVKAACDPKLAVTVTCKVGTAWDQAKCACTAAKLSCANLRCASGYHCEEKGINGGTVPACIKDDKTDCRTNGCSKGSYCSACWGSFACIPNGALC